MTQIKIKKARNFPSGEQFFPITHTKAVIDDNGYTAESKLQAMQEEINNLQDGVVVVGEGMTPVPSDLTPTEDSTNWVTSGGVYNAIQVVQSDLTELSGKLGFAAEVRFVEGTAYINTSGAVASSTTSHYSYPFLLQKGQEIKVITGGTGVAHISSTTDPTGNSKPYTPLVTSNSSGVYSYTATEDIYIVICLRVSGGTYSITPDGLLIAQVAKNTFEVSRLAGNVIDGDYIQGDEISLTSILPGYIRTNGEYLSYSGFSTNTYRVDDIEKIMVEVQPFTEPSTKWFFYVFWSDSQAVTPTTERTEYANNSKFVLDVPQGSMFFGIMTVVKVDNVSYGSTSNVSVFKCSSLQSEVAKIKSDLYSSPTTDFPIVLNYLTIKNGYVYRDHGNFIARQDDTIQTAFFDVSKSISLRVNCVTPAGAPNCAFYGADGVTALNGKLEYHDGSEFIVPNGAVYFAITFRFNDNLNIDTFTIRANAGIINQVESLNDIADLYKSLFDWSSFTWLLVGDSLTESNYRAETQYYEWMADKTNIHWINKGMSGKGYANGDYFYSVFNSLTESFSFATIFGSGNDIRYESFPTLSSYSTWDAALGDIDDNGTTSICGYINRALDKFYEVSPLKKIGLITPTPWKNGSANNVTLTDEETRYRMKTYSEKLVLIAKKRGIPCLDLFNSSGLRPWNEDFRVEYYNENGVQDGGVHPNSKGHKWISNMFLNFIFQYLVE